MLAQMHEKYDFRPPSRRWIDVQHECTHGCTGTVVLSNTLCIEGSANAEQMLGLMGQLVTEEVNRTLMAAWTDDEILRAFQYGDHKGS
jgi:hypothetical protein